MYLRQQHYHKNLKPFVFRTCTDILKNASNNFFFVYKSGWFRSNQKFNIFHWLSSKLHRKLASLTYVWTAFFNFWVSKQQHYGQKFLGPCSCYVIKRWLYGYVVINTQEAVHEWFMILKVLSLIAIPVTDFCWRVADNWVAPLSPARFVLLSFYILFQD